jgi:predicted RNase H-like HicB family nuclease
MKTEGLLIFSLKTARVPEGKFTVILREEEGGYSVQCIELLGAISQGETRQEALDNIREAIQGYLEAFPEEADRMQLKKEVVEIKCHLQLTAQKALDHLNDLPLSFTFPFAKIFTTSGSHPNETEAECN